MKTRKVYTLMLTVILCLTFLDIFVVETFYRPTHDWTNIWKYHIIYWTLIITVPLIISYKTKNTTFLLIYVLFFFGVEDTMFYVFQGYLPSKFWGVTFCGFIFEPMLVSGLWLNVAGLSIVGLLNEVKHCLQAYKK